MLQCGMTFAINIIKTEIKSEEIYSSSELYPSVPYDYRISVGMDGKENVMFCTVKCYQVRYSPAENILYYCNNCRFV